MADTIRDDLAVLIGDLINVWTIGNPKGLADPDLPSHLARGVLAYLGNLDPDADPELIAWHLRENANEIERLRRDLETARRRLAGEQKRVATQTRSIAQYQRNEDRLRVYAEAFHRIMTAYRLDTCPDRELWDALAAAESIHRRRGRGHGRGDHLHGRT